MTLPVARIGDRSDHGGIIITANEGFIRDDNGQLVALNGALHSCPIPYHGITAITATSTVSYSSNNKIVRLGDMAACGAKIITASDLTFSD